MSGPSSIVVDEDAIAGFRRDGFVLFAGVFDHAVLANEIERVLDDAFASRALPQDGSGGIRFSSVPMMSERTPVSAELADSLAEPASRLLGREVLPGRAKGTRYLGESEWHCDSDLDVPSLGFVAYLEPLTRGQGALEVRPGSHVSSADATRLEPRALETQPGDIVAFDEHLTHGSRGGGTRHQWRVDYTADPRDDREEHLVRRSFAHIFDARWDGGYDVDRYPSYGDWWQAAHQTWTRRLRALGVLDMARAQEDLMRQRRSRADG